LPLNKIDKPIFLIVNCIFILRLIFVYGNWKLRKIWADNVRNEEERRRRRRRRREI
jgi:hypothetical protein